MTRVVSTKFMFDTDFSHIEAANAPEPEAQTEEDQVAEEEAEDLVEPEPEVPAEPTFSTEDLEQARAEGFQAGRDEALKDLRGSQEQKLTNALTGLDAKLTELFTAYEAERDERQKNAIGIATVIVRKLFPALNMDKAIDEIEHMITQAMNRISDEPKLTFTVAQDMRDLVEERAGAIASKRGREGTIVVIGDDAMESGDCKVAWAGGGMVRDQAAMWQDIDDIIERNLGSKPDGPPAPEMVEKVEIAAPVMDDDTTLDPASDGNDEGESP